MAKLDVLTQREEENTKMRVRNWSVNLGVIVSDDMPKEEKEKKMREDLTPLGDFDNSRTLMMLADIVNFVAREAKRKDVFQERLNVFCDSIVDLLESATGGRSESATTNSQSINTVTGEAVQLVTKDGKFSQALGKQIELIWRCLRLLDKDLPTLYKQVDIAESDESKMDDNTLLH